MGRAFSLHIPPRQVRLGSVSDNHYTHQWTINHQFLLLVICQWGRKWWTTHRTYYVDIVRYWPNPHTFGSGREMESMCTRWKECVHDHLNAFVWELSSYISDPLQLSSPFSWHSQVAKFKMEDKYLRRVLLWNLENRHTPNMPFTPKLHKIQFRISYKFQ